VKAGAKLARDEAKGSVFGLTEEESRAAQEREYQQLEAQRKKEQATMSPAAIKLQKARRECEARLSGLRAISDTAIRSLLSRTAHVEAGVTSLGIANKVRRLSKMAGGTMKQGDAPLMDEFDRANLRVLEELQRAQQGNADEGAARPAGSAVGAVQARRGSKMSNGRRQSRAGERRQSKAGERRQSRAGERRQSNGGEAVQRHVMLPAPTQATVAKKQAALKAQAALSKLADDDSTGVIPMEARLALARRVLRVLREEHVREAAPKYDRAVAEYNNPTHVPVSVEQVRAFVKKSDEGAEEVGEEEEGVAKRRDSVGTEHAELLQRRAMQQVKSTDIHTRYNNAAGGGLQQRRDRRGRARELAEMMMNSDCKKPRWPEFNPFSMLNRSKNQLVRVTCSALVPETSGCTLYSYA
jgi:hypothetical protein